MKTFIKFSYFFLSAISIPSSIETSYIMLNVIWMIENLHTLEPRYSVPGNKVKYFTGIKYRTEIPSVFILFLFYPYRLYRVHSIFLKATQSEKKLRMGAKRTGVCL